MTNKNLFQFSVPAKNFILGEYAVLAQGTAILFTHAPRFVLTAALGQSELANIHLASPAGKFYQHFKSLFEPYRITFSDPYQGIGGLGASSAQFVLLYAFYLQLQAHHFDLSELLSTYQAFAWSGQGLPPSGADVVAQSMGGFLCWDPKTKTSQQLDWPFSDLSFHFIHTCHKINTHDHLNTLQSNFDVTELNQATQTALVALKKRNSIDFCNAVNLYADLLRQQSLTAANTLQLLTHLKKLEGILAAKGCGALGSDVIFVVTEKQKEATFRDWIKTHNLRYLGDQDSASQGLIFESMRKKI